MTYYCPNCQKNILKDAIHERRDGLKLCPLCSGTLALLDIPNPKPVIDFSAFLPTLDQLRYLRHMNQKQQSKLEHALEQTHGIETKLQIMEEMIKELESK